MYVQYGTYAHARNEAAVQIGKQALFSPRGYRRGLRETWRIVGVLQAADPGSLTEALASLRTAYATNGLDLGLYHDDGTPTDHRIISANTLGGTRVLHSAFPEGTGAEYSTFRSYSITVEAETPDTTHDVLEFSEVVSFVGTGGPRLVFLETLAGPPQTQIARQFTTYRARQEGRAVGLTSYPTVPPPVWPAAELVDQRRVSLHTPRRTATSLSEYAVEWAYQFESTTPLTGTPTAP
ncbi:MAG: hypothetical protein JSS02_18275 [Planctomycetes bacterium]|nr:hypothetical protein [Planctomycetota bacterium]